MSNSKCEDELMFKFEKNWPFNKLNNLIKLKNLILFNYKAKAYSVNKHN